MKLSFRIVLLMLALLVRAFACPAGTIPAQWEDLSRFLSRGEAALLPAEGNDFEIMDNGARKWELLLQDIRQARKTIYMEYYRWANDDAGRQIYDAVMEKIKEGLDVRLLIEDIANPFYRLDFYWKLREAGAQLIFFTDTERHQLWEALPGINIRDHRKIVVIDGQLGYVGGMNLADHYLYSWRDTHVRVKGPAVAALTKLFCDMWIARGGSAQGLYAPQPEPLPEGGGSAVQFATTGGGDTLLLEAVCRILDSAREYVYFQNPYFCPPDCLLEALYNAAGRGVDVRIIVPQESDMAMMTLANQSFFEDCLVAGVRIFEYTTRFNHSKVILADGNLSVVGSLNLDARSLNTNHEVVAAIYGPDAARTLGTQFQELFSQSKEVSLEDLSSWTTHDRNARRFWRRHRSLL